MIFLNFLKNQIFPRRKIRKKLSKILNTLHLFKESSIRINFSFLLAKLSRFQFFSTFPRKFSTSKMVWKMDLFLSRKNFFDIWNLSGTPNYLRKAVEIIPVSSSVQKLFQQHCAWIACYANFDDVRRILKLKLCLNDCDLECFEDTSRRNFSRGSR